MHTGSLRMACKQMAWQPAVPCGGIMRRKPAAPPLQPQQRQVATPPALLAAAAAAAAARSGAGLSATVSYDKPGGSGAATFGAAASAPTAAAATAAAAAAGRPGLISFSRGSGSGAAAFGGASGAGAAGAAAPGGLKERLARYGLAGVLAYGLTNTAYYTCMFLFAWTCIAKVPHGLGLAGAAQKFAEVFAITWAGSQVTKAPRAALALALAPLADRLLDAARARLGLGSRRRAFAAAVVACVCVALLLFAGVVVAYA